MPKNLGVLGERYSIEEVRELRKQDQAEIKKLKAEKKMLEDKVSELSRLARPFMEKLFPGSLQSQEIPAGNYSILMVILGIFLPVFCLFNGDFFNFSLGSIVSVSV